MSTPATNTNRSQHSWKFYRAGGVDQVALRTGSDILNLASLDQKLWVALACPTRGVEFDTKTLDLIDADKDGRVRVPEVRTAIEWTSRLFKNLDDLTRGSDSLPLSLLNEKSDAGATVLAGAKRILENLGKPNATSITLADVADTARIFAATTFNGDGIIPADAAADEATQKAIGDIIATLGSVTDRSGKPGVDQAKADAFFEQATALNNWRTQGESDKALMPLGDATAAALQRR